METGRSARISFCSLALLLAASFPSHAHAQYGPTLNPGDRYTFIGADVDRDLGPGCDGLVNGCGVDYGDLGANSPRMYVDSAVNAGVAGTTRTATGRLAHVFSVSTGPDHRIAAKLIGIVTWRGWLQADIGAYDNTTSGEIGVSIYDVTTGTRHLVANQMVHTNSVGGTISDPPIPNFVRDFGHAGFDLVVDLQRGHDYLAAVEATATSTSGLVGLFAATSYSTYGHGHNALNDGYVEQTSMSITLEPDYLAAVDSLREEFQHHTHNYLTGRGVGQNDTRAVTSQPVDDAPTPPPSPGNSGDHTSGGPGLTVVTAAPDHVELWAVPLPGSQSPVLERRTGDTDWTRIGAIAGSGTFVDRGLTPGNRYGYRLSATVSGMESVSDEVWVDLPTRLALGIERNGQNPLIGSFRTTFTLPAGSPATLALFDVHGRLVSMREVGTLGLGRHTVDLSPTERVASGIYLLRLTQDGNSVSTKVIVIR